MGLSKKSSPSSSPRRNFSLPRLKLQSQAPRNDDDESPKNPRKSPRRRRARNYPRRRSPPRRPEKPERPENPKNPKRHESPERLPKSQSRRPEKLEKAENLLKRAKNLPDPKNFD